MLPTPQSARGNHGGDIGGGKDIVPRSHDRSRPADGPGSSASRLPITILYSIITMRGWWNSGTRKADQTSFIPHRFTQKFRLSAVENITFWFIENQAPEVLYIVARKYWRPGPNENIHQYRHCRCVCYTQWGRQRPSPVREVRGPYPSERSGAPHPSVYQASQVEEDATGSLVDPVPVQRDWITCLVAGQVKHKTEPPVN